MNRALTAILGMAVAAEAGAAERWIEAKSPNLTVVTDAGEGRARSTAWELEQARAAFASLWPWATLAKGRPTVVVAAKDENTMKRWLPAYWETKGVIRPASYSAWGMDRQYLLLRLDTGSTSTPEVTEYFTLYRGYVSTLLSTSLERPLPSWLHVGLSEVYGNTSVRDKEVHVGRIVPWYLREFRNNARRPLAEILAAKRGSNLLLKDDERTRFDAQCWTLVHYLTFGDQSAHAKSLDRFIHLWLAGRTQEAAWAEAFGEVRAVEERLLVYATKAVFQYGRLRADVNLERERLPVRPVSPAESAALRASVLVATGRTTEAQGAIQEARAADPKAPESFDAEGLLADRENDAERAARAYGQATELGSTNAFTYYRAAHLAGKPSPDAETLQAIRKRLERAVELNDSYAPAQAYLAEVMAQLGDAAAALPVAQRALALEPGDSGNQLTVARVYHRIGDEASARKAAGRALELADQGYEQSNARSFLAFLDQESSFRKQQAAHEATRARDTACQGGDAAACAELLPGLERSCSEGHANACSYAAWLFEEGRGFAKDLPRAAGFQKRACDAGDRQTCVQLAWKQATGTGLPKNEAQAMAALDALCTDKVFSACTQLAILHSRKPAAKDRAKARELFAQACEGGDPSACSLARSFPR
jgi:TPR repeat protein